MKAKVGEATVHAGATAIAQGSEAQTAVGVARVGTESASPFLPTEGVIKLWNSRQGFIARVGHKDDLFFHRYGVAKDYYNPAVGDRVQFDVASSRSGRVYAINVRRC